MKKQVKLLFVAFTLLVSLLNANNIYALSAKGQAKLNNSIALFINNHQAYVNSKKTQIDPSNETVTPLVKDGRTLVPVRFISENFGAQVSWDGNTSTVTVTLNDKVISLVLKNKIMKVNGSEVVLDVPAQSINGRVFIPLRALVESLDKNVFWDNRGLIVISNKDVSIDKNQDLDAVNEIVDLYTNKSANANLTDAKGKLKALGIDFNESAFADCIKQKKSDAINLFLDAGINLNTTVEGLPALSYAIDQDNLELALILVNKGADVNLKGKTGITPLMASTTKNYLDLSKILIVSGADINAKDNYGNTVLMYAVASNSSESVKLLMDKGADVNAENDIGLTVSIIAESSKVNDTIKEYVKKKPQTQGNSSQKDSVSQFEQMFRNADLLRESSFKGVEYSVANSTGSSEEDKNSVERISTFFSYFIKGKLYDSASADSCGIYKLSPYREGILKLASQVKELVDSGKTLDMEWKNYQIYAVGKLDGKAKVTIVRLDVIVEGKNTGSEYYVAIKDGDKWAYYGSLTPLQ